MPLNLNSIFYLKARDWGLPAGFPVAQLTTKDTKENERIALELTPYSLSAQVLAVNLVILASPWDLIQFNVGSRLFGEGPGNNVSWN